MARYIVERQYLLPVYEQLLIDAPDLEAACREAVDEIAHPWSDNAEEDFESARPVTITEAVQLPEGQYPELQASETSYHASLGTLLYHSGLALLPIPVAFAEEAERSELIGFS